jgi:ribosomal protein L37AE/L43A
MELNEIQTINHENEIPEIAGQFCKHNGLLLVEVLCPYCGKKHYHSRAPLPDWRRSHCGWDGKRGQELDWYLERYPKAITGGTYYIKEVNGLKLPTTIPNEAGKE